MLKIKNGKLYGLNYSFALPEGFNLIVDDDFYGNRLAFIADDKILNIEIYFEKECNSAKNDIQVIVDDSCMIKMGDFISVKRGQGVGIGLFYKDESGDFQHYDERYDFKRNDDDETQLIIEIYLYSCRKKLEQTIQEALELPAVKSFLESIEYF